MDKTVRARFWIIIFLAAALMTGSIDYTSAKIAKYNYPFPKAVTKKGLQINGQLAEDAMELGVQHSIVNVVLTAMIAPASRRNEGASYPWTYHGKTYWYLKSQIASYDRQLKSLAENNTIVSAVMLLGYRSDLTRLIPPGCRNAGHDWYSWNVQEAGPRQELAAAIAFLADRYSAKNGRHGRIVNWIVGNEVNDYTYGHYAGKTTLRSFAKNYAQTIRMVYETVTDYYSNARVYMSLNHLWNCPTPYSFSARSVLDATAAFLKKNGDIPWNLAYHPYSSPLTEPKFWKNKNKMVTAALSSPVINMGNISLLSSYIKEKYGADTRIILSEQGYTSRQRKKDRQTEQSAAIAYSYYLTEADDQIDSFIMNRHIDHQVEIDQGLNLGLWTASGVEWAKSKKTAWKVFKYMDTNLSPSVADRFLKTIGIRQWTDKVKGYSADLYTKRIYTTGNIQRVKSYKKKKNLRNAWLAYGAAGQLQKKRGSISVSHNASRNRNAVWGISQRFKKLNLKKYNRFLTTLQVNGETSGKARVKIRFFSGNTHILECQAFVRCGKETPLAISLRNWDRKNQITRIQILIAPAKGSWSDSAALSIAKTGVS